ncbi:phosphatase PAP2 family protein [Ilumatobacter sp.]|uniref:phosphatase PAP2 family protein n=1 Tax=Ilumatobacter sp. TaxID=1967498 RepID=UPI003AF707F4
MTTAIGPKGVAVVAGAGTAVLALCDSARRARTGRVGATEAHVFRRFNDAPDWLHVPVWPVMQSGSLGAAYAAAGVLARADRPRAAAAAALVGTAVWGGAKVVKHRVRRGRPDDVLGHVTIRGAAQTGMGYPSGHVAVAMTWASVAAPSPAAAWVGALVLGGIVGGSRMYVGAHLPLDVVGGLALGALCGLGSRAVLSAWP